MSKANVYVTAGIKVTDRDGKVLSDKTFRSKSLLRQWQRMIYGQMRGVDVNVTDTGNNPRALGTGAGILWECLALAANVDYGIMLGRDATAVAMNDHVLGTPIAEGVGANQMNHALDVITNVEAAGGDYVQIQRVATNNSAGDITIQEIGLVAREHPNLWNFLLIRDVTGPTLVVAGASATVTFQIHNNL